MQNLQIEFTKTSDELTTIIHYSDLSICIIIIIETDSNFLSIGSNIHVYRSHYTTDNNSLYTRDRHRLTSTSQSNVHVLMIRLDCTPQPPQYLDEYSCSRSLECGKASAEPTAFKIPTAGNAPPQPARES